MGAAKRASGRRAGFRESGIVGSMRRWLIILLSLFGAVMLPGLAGCSPTLSRHEFTRVAMGVRTRVVVYAPSEARAETAAAAAFDRIAAIEEIMSDYRPRSELSRLGETSGFAVEVSEELFEILGEAQRISLATGGAFDITVGPLVRLWRESARTGRLAPAEQVEAARERVGFELLRLDPGGRSVRLERPGMRLDLGGIAKGYAAEAAVMELARLGLPRAMVALGGDVYAGEAPPRARGWRVSIAHDGSTLEIARMGVSSSGETEQFVEIDGARYSHLLDPRTGLGTSGGVAATVLSRRGAWADALPTAVCILQHADFIADFPETGAIIFRGEGERQVVDPWGVVSRAERLSEK